MKNKIKKFNKFSFGNELVESTFKIKGIISSTIVGSFNDKKEINFKSDIDLILICNKLSKKIFNECIKTIKKIDLKKYNINKHKILINSTFGPLKFKLTNKILVHLMIYDIKGHINHVINSPFTCLDWERSSWNKGIKLKKIFPVGSLQFNDFKNARRGIYDYVRDLKNNSITYRKYQFTNQNIIQKKGIKQIDNIHAIEFSYHIINNLLINLYKYELQKNLLPSLKTIKLLLKKVTNDDYFLMHKIFLIMNIKNNNLNLLNKNLKNEFIKTTEKFIKYFVEYIENLNKKNIKIIFIRHAKTKYKKNLFIGQKLNPQILKKNKILKCFDNYFEKSISSPSIRAIETANLFLNKKDIILNNNLLEIDYGKVEGKDINYLIKNYPKIYKKWNEKKDVRFPCGENYANVIRRINNFEKNIFTITKNHKKILVVTHNVFLRCLIGKNFKLPTYMLHYILIKHMQSFEYFICNGKLRANIDRKILKIFEQVLI